MDSHHKQFISGRFLREEEFNFDPIFLRYFPTDLGRMFLSYFFAFGGEEQSLPWGVERLFTEHTGCVIARRTLQKFRQRAESLVRLRSKLKSSFDLEAMHRLQTGGYTLSEIIKASQDNGIENGHQRSTVQTARLQ